MYLLRLYAVLLIALLAGASGRTEDLRDKFVGKSACSPDLKSDAPDFSLRLDKTNGTYLIARKLTKAKILMIVKYKDEADRCGVVVDLVENHDVRNDFEFNCVDPMLPTAVVVGTRASSDSKLTGVAAERWRINLREQKFIQLPDHVECTRQGYSGSDEGSDLASLAKQRAYQKKP